MDFEKRFRELESMVKSESAMNLFSQEYAHLLEEVKALPGPRFEKVQRMQRLLFHQAEYLMNEWLRAKAIDKMSGSGQEVVREGMN